jgi:hypothetical protein
MPKRQVFLTKENLAALPPLYSQEKLGDAAIAHVKFFCPWNRWTWFATEYDPKDGLFFGLVKGHEDELGYFSAEELQSVTGPFGLYIERDIHFTPRALAECYKANT